MKIPFAKYCGNGNDFIIIEETFFRQSPEWVRRICDRHFGIGADGVLVAGKEPAIDGTMRIYNADGGEAEMCGNGLRCLVTYLDDKGPRKDSFRIKTMNNTYEVSKRNGRFAVLMDDIRDLNTTDLSEFTAFENKFFVNTGVPHLVLLGKDIKKIDIKKTAPEYRHHKMFPRGTNVSFVELLPEVQSAYVRTFERGVEDETHSCGTGLTACGLALSNWFGWEDDIHLHTLGGKQVVNVGDKIFYSGEVTFCFEGTVDAG